jgi:hypothetical protein
MRRPRGPRCGRVIRLVVAGWAGVRAVRVPIAVVLGRLVCNGLPGDAAEADVFGQRLRRFWLEHRADEGDQQAGDEAPCREASDVAPADPGLAHNGDKPTAMRDAPRYSRPPLWPFLNTNWF